MATYNGWTNRETWLVNVWYEPNSVDDIEYAKMDLEEQVNHLDGILADMIDLSAINWQELEESLED